MDESKVLIITSRGDQTREIASIRNIGHKVEICFYKNEKCYEYNATKIVIKQNPIKLNTQLSHLKK